MRAEDDRHILVVDDNVTNLQLTAAILKNEGFLISLAESGPAALEQLEKDRPSLILLDVMMPGMDGYQVCRVIKQNEKISEIPVIFLTAKNQTEDLVEGFNAGGVDYLTKPFNRQELLVRVRKHLELEASKRKIVEMNKTRNKLYSIIAHDIRSPFSAITQTINAIAEGYIDTGSEDFMQIMKDLEVTAGNTSVLLDNLLQWTKTQSESITISLKVTDLAYVLKDCIQLYRGNAEIKKIHLTLDVPQNLVSVCDEVTIHTVFRNLLSNAIKFTPQDGSITVTGKIEEDYVKVSVVDTGLGMTKEVVDKIFVRGEHHSSIGTGSESGTGLGLVMVKDFVQKNNGRLDIESEPGKGTTISVYIPKATHESAFLTDHKVDF